MKIKHHILDDDNHVVEVSLMEWAMWVETTPIGRRCVGHTQVTSQIEVSTVFVMIDMNFYGRGPPILFETMIFGGPLHHYTWRYSSWDDADVGHKMAVKRAREAIGQKVEESNGGR